MSSDPPPSLLRLSETKNWPHLLSLLITDPPPLLPTQLSIGSRFTILHNALHRGATPELIRKIIQLYPSLLKIPDVRGQYPLTLAFVYYQHLETLKIFIDKTPEYLWGVCDLGELFERVKYIPAKRVLKEGRRKYELWKILLMGCMKGGGEGWGNIMGRLYKREKGLCRLIVGFVCG